MKKSVQSCAESGFKGNKQQIVVAPNIGGRNWSSPRLQNSPYFYVFKYARTVKKKRSGPRLKTESETTRPEGV